jgi:hypothetical protein
MFPLTHLAHHTHTHTHTHIHVPTSRTNAVVSALVQHIIRSWREHFARSVAMKFNCFFLMPFIDEFPFYLRQELDRVYEGDMAHLFDISELKQALKRKRDDLIAECKANERLQGKFDVIDSQLRASKLALESPDDDEEDDIISPPDDGGHGHGYGYGSGGYEEEPMDMGMGGEGPLDDGEDWDGGYDEGGMGMGMEAGGSGRRFEDEVNDILGPLPPPPGPAPGGGGRNMSSDSEVRGRGCGCEGLGGGERVEEWAPRELVDWKGVLTNTIQHNTTQNTQGRRRTPSFF